MAINATVTKSGKKALPEFVKKILVIYISSFKIKFQSLPFFTWAVTDDPHAAHWSRIKLQIE